MRRQRRVNALEIVIAPFQKGYNAKHRKLQDAATFLEAFPELHKSMMEILLCQHVIREDQQVVGAAEFIGGADNKPVGTNELLGVTDELLVGADE